MTFSCPTRRENPRKIRSCCDVAVSLACVFTFDRFAKYSPGPNQLMLTKGDNNHVDDIELYQGLDFLERRHIVGKVRGYVDWFLGN